MADARVLTWHDRHEFELGALYVDAGGGGTVEFIGLVTAELAKQIVTHTGGVEESVTAHGDEAVLIFRQVSAPAEGFWTYTRLHSDQGDALRVLADRIADESDVVD